MLKYRVSQVTESFPAGFLFLSHLILWMLTSSSVFLFIYKIENKSLSWSYRGVITFNSLKHNLWYLQKQNNCHAKDKRRGVISFSFFLCLIRSVNITRTVPPDVSRYVVEEGGLLHPVLLAHLVVVQDVARAPLHLPGLGVREIRVRAENSRSESQIKTIVL